MLTLAFALGVLIQSPAQARPMTEAERKANYDHWERCVNVKPDADVNAAMASCNELLNPAVPLSTADRGVVYAKRGVLRARVNLWNVALEDLVVALGMVPADLRNWVTLERGLAYSELRQYANAIRDLSVVIASEPATSDDYTRAVIGRGIAYLVTRDYRRALADLDGIMTAKGRGNAYLFYLRALARGTLGDMSGARADMAEAVRLDPGIEAVMKGYAIDLPVVPGLTAGGPTGGVPGGVTPVPSVDVGELLYQARLRVEATRGMDAVVERTRYAEEGLAITAELLRAQPENIDGLLYRSILLRTVALGVTDPNRQKALIAEANGLRAKADALMKRR